MIQAAKRELSLIDWRQTITQVVIAGAISFSGAYTAIRIEVEQLRGMISGRVAQREAQLAAINQTDARMQEELDRLRGEFVSCRENVARLASRMEVLHK